MAGVRANVQRIPIAFLDVYFRASVNEEFGRTGKILDIYPNVDFYFGRSDSWLAAFEANRLQLTDSCSQYSSTDPTVSNKHLHFHCIIFEEGGSEDYIPPLVYVEDLSTNGTYLSRANSDLPTAKERRMSRREGKILLSSGDQLRVSPTLALRFRYSRTVIPNSHCLKPGQLREAEVTLQTFILCHHS
jgi:hypothetical protein